MVRETLMFLLSLRLGKKFYKCYFGTSILHRHLLTLRLISVFLILFQSLFHVTVHSLISLMTVDFSSSFGSTLFSIV